MEICLTLFRSTRMSHRLLASVHIVNVNDDYFVLEKSPLSKETIKKHRLQRQMFPGLKHERSYLSGCFEPCF